MKGPLSLVWSLLAITAIEAQTNEVRTRNPEFAYPDGAALRTAIAEFNEGGVQGTVKFTQSGRSPVVLSGQIRGLTPGPHGFHIHVSNNITFGCAGAGPHFNPERKYHGDRHNKERHVGDLGNIESDASQTATIAFEDSVIQLTGPHGIVGRSVVIHEMPDDGGKGGTEDSLQTGSAGRRVACAAIKPKFPPGPWPEDNAAHRWQSSSFVILTTLITFILARVA